MRFSDVIGHKEQIHNLVALANRKRVPHALLFHGPSGVGKTTVARAFIQYLYCSNPVNGDSCGKCPACLQTSKLNNPDVHFVFPIVKKSNPPKAISADYAQEWSQLLNNFPFMPPLQWLDIIDAGNSRPMIYVNESEELLRISSLSSYGNGKKIFLIWQPEKMNAEAANKLLKVIEEPFEDTVFILVSNNPAEIMPTIRSRLQSFEFKPLPHSEIRDYLLNSGKSPQEAESLAAIARGNMNSASVLADSSGEFNVFKEDFIQVMRACYARKMPELKTLADKFAAYGREKSLRLLNYFARMIRESFISNLKDPAFVALTPDESTFVEKFHPFINAANVEELASEIDRAVNDISRNANQKIVWFDLFLEFSRLIRTKGIPNS